MTSTYADEIPSRHWADVAADELIQKHPGKNTFVCASGISPSGVVHIGNFREVITVDFVVRALRERGKTVRFIYSWDDYDALRKVPANLPNEEGIKASLRKPLALAPDPFGEEKSYAAHFEKLFEREIGILGVKPEFIYQSERYQSCVYADGIRQAIEAEKRIVAILNKHRTEPLPADWTSLSIFCKKCGRDTTTLSKYEAPTTVHYTCKCSGAETLTIDFKKEPGVKLLWRVDWPMRWAHEGVDFEPGGKDHSSQGGSYDTGAEIVREVWKREAPHYVQYDFVLAKGLGTKLSSSSGNLISISQALEVYEPEIVRWIFASRKPNLDFTIAFDLDVMKAYDEFDRTERYAYGVEPGDEKKIVYERRIHDLSMLKPREKQLPAQFQFRHLCNLLQIHEGNLEKTRASLGNAIKTPLEEARFTSRATRAWKWITTFAPNEFKFRLRGADGEVPKAKHPKALGELITLLKLGQIETLSEEEIAGKIYEIMKSNGLQAKEFFQDVYGILIDRPMGPKLASLILAGGPTRVAFILERAL